MEEAERLGERRGAAREDGAPRRMQQQYAEYAMRYPRRRRRRAARADPVSNLNYRDMAPIPEYYDRRASADSARAIIHTMP